MFKRFGKDIVKQEAKEKVATQTAKSVGKNSAETPKKEDAPHYECFRF